MSSVVRIVVVVVGLLVSLPAWAQPQGEATSEEATSSLGINPSTPQVGDLILPASRAAGTTSTTKKFSFHGFLRIPLRLGLGKNAMATPGVEGGTKLHVPPHVPDSNYTDWQYTNGMGGPWTELWLSYGNSSVMAHVVLASYDVSDASYRDPQSQLGISQSFVTLNAPRVFGDRGGLSWNVGAFASRYGTSGRYDAGKYDTYLFGATHAAGESLAASYAVTDDLVLQAEHGFGAKLGVVPLVPGLPSVPYFPYPGPVQQGSTLLHHAHLGATYADKVTFALHYLSSWTDDAALPGELDGRISIMGGELKLVDSKYGNGYLGFAHLDARDPLRVAGAIETLHSSEGWSVRNNFFGPDATGTGTIDTVQLQYTFSLSTLLWAPAKFWGQGPDLLVSVFGMYNRVASDDPLFTAPDQKLKLGAETTYSWQSWLGLSLRYDLVQPNLDDSNESFQVISPKVILRSEYVSNEQLVIQYSRYVNGDNVRLPYPYQGLAADENVFKISAIMWW